jgi:hypothetical protein
MIGLMGDNADPAGIVSTSQTVGGIDSRHSIAYDDIVQKPDPPSPDESFNIDNMARLFHSCNSILI